MKRRLYTEEQEAFIRKKINQERLHPQLWFAEFNTTFAIAISGEAIWQKAKRMNLSTEHLQMETAEQIKERQAAIEAEAEVKTDDERREDAIRELEEKRKLKFDKRELTRLRQREHFENQVLDLIEKKVVSLPSLPFQPTQKKNIQTEETFVALLSDAHFGEVVDIEIMQGLNEYNFKIAAERIERYAHIIVKLATQTLQGYKFRKLVLFILGDMVSGRIHQELIETQDLDTVEQVFDGAAIVSAFIRHLVPHFEEIEVVARPGNHGRWSKKKAYKQPHYNWDYFLYRTVMSQLLNQERLTWDVVKAYHAQTEIEGWNFMSYHGDDVQSWMQIPWYGLQRHDLKMSGALAAQQKYYRYVLLAHFHADTKVPRPGGGKMFINGSVMGTDEFAFQKIGAYEPPEQKIFSVHERHGISIELTANLDEGT